MNFTVILTTHFLKGSCKIHGRVKSRDIKELKNLLKSTTMISFQIHIVFYDIFCNYTEMIIVDFNFRKIKCIRNIAAFAFLQEVTGFEIRSYTE